MELYSACTPFGQPETFGLAPIEWFTQRRVSGVVDYVSVVMGYERMEEDERHAAEMIISEMFTREEAEALRDYLATSFGLAMRMRPYPLPLLRFVRRSGVTKVRVPWSVSAREGVMVSLGRAAEHAVGVPVCGRVICASRAKARKDTSGVG